MIEDRSGYEKAKKSIIDNSRPGCFETFHQLLDLSRKHDDEDGEWDAYDYLEAGELDDWDD